MFLSLPSSRTHAASSMIEMITFVVSRTSGRQVYLIYDDIFTGRIDYVDHQTQTHTYRCGWEGFLKRTGCPPPFFLLHHMNKVKPSPKDSLNYIDPLTGGSVKPAAVSHGW